MTKKWMKLCSMLLVIVMVIHMLPMQTLATDAETNESKQTTDEVTVEKEIDEAVTEEISTGTIVGEITENRTEYTKEFRLDNGAILAAVYNEPVHYRKGGQWKEIDNTLKAQSDGSYTNTAGVWDVVFPQALGGAEKITITKDGYTLSFGMSGELRQTGNLEVMNTGETKAESLLQTEITSTTTELEKIPTTEDPPIAKITIDGTEQTFSVSSANTAKIQIQKVDLTQTKAEAKHAETVAERLVSKLTYANVYTGTDIRYDLRSNEVKESVVMHSYNNKLKGYRFSLDAGELIPQLQKDGSILFYDKTQENVVMAMPAPFLMDNNLETNYDVKVHLAAIGSTHTLTYLLPQEWLASSERAWPVILDPVVVAELTDNNIQDTTVISARKSEADYLRATLQIGYSNNDGISRIFLRFDELPALSSSDVVLGAEISLNKIGNSQTAIPAELHKAEGNWSVSTLCWNNMPSYNPTVEDYAMIQTSGRCYWNVTDLVRDWYETENYGVVIKATDEMETSAHSDKWKEFYSCNYADDPTDPCLTIMYRNNNGLENYWDYTTYSAGRAGTGYINNYTGNLVWVRPDMGFGGNRMPVTINHVYNANDSLSNDFGLGFGWRTNYNQRVYQYTADSSYYIWEDGDGTEHYFKYASASTYKDEDGLELTLKTNGSGTKKYSITDKNGNISYFDTSGRLTLLQNNQATLSTNTITYVDSGNLISTITDGVGRKYYFTYTSGLLSKISYKATGSTELSYVTFTYNSAKRMITVTDKDGETTHYAYTTNNLLKSVQDVDGYKLTNSYNVIKTGKPARISKVVESHNGATGGELNITYQHNQTTFTDVNGNKQILQFNNMGNTVSIQDGEGRAQYAAYAKNEVDETTKGNQLQFASKLQNTVTNYMPHHTFEYGHKWTSNSETTLTVATSTAAAHQGNKSLKITSTATDEVAALSPTTPVAAGQTVTFSAFVKSTNAQGYIALYNSADGTIYPGPTYTAGQDWTRIQTSYTNTTTASVNITCAVFVDGSGTAYVDNAQIEKETTASRLNLIENGDFRNTRTNYPALNWTGTNLASTDVRTTGTQATPKMTNHMFSITGSPTAQKRLTQTVKFNGAAKDTFVLAGWAKGNSVPTPEAGTGVNQRRFALQAVFNYTDGSTSDPFYAHFNPDSSQWQYSATALVAQKAYSSITVLVMYDYNMNTVYFDGIQLYREEFGTSYTYDDKGNVISVVDLQKQNTTYEYDANNNLKKIIQDNKAKMTYTYDNYHNVLTATSSEGLVYTFTYDAYGNNTSVSIGAGDIRMTGSAQYTADGNRLVSTTDAVGKTTQYSYHADTNVLEWVQYPEDTEATRTNYTYDSMYRVATIACTTDTQSAMSAEYTYENDLLTSIETGGTVYQFTYGNFALRSSVKVGSKTLASYSYTEDRNNRLKALDYGNGDKVEYTYDKLGRLLTQTYEDGATVTYHYDNSGALAKLTDSVTGRTTLYFYDFSDRLMEYSETGAGFTHSLSYTYDDQNNLSEMTESINGEENTVSYTYDDDNRVVSVASGNAVKQNYYDDYGRINRQELKIGSQIIKNSSYDYQSPSEATTAGQLAGYSVIAGTYVNREEYVYDDNGNITLEAYIHGKLYTYDSANQLIWSHDSRSNTSWFWTYDSSGNILTETVYAGWIESEDGATPTATTQYHYTDADWPDLLTGITKNGVYTPITYDNVGNPLSDGNRTYTWRHGRQLATVAQNGSTWTNTYDANGMRVSRTDGTATYTYVYNGSQLTQLSIYGETMRFTYDEAGNPMILTHEGVEYYYVTNPQGDVLAIVDATGYPVATYHYDPWGKVLNYTAEGDGFIGCVNPLLYRGYVYDWDTELYYLQSRYYDPSLRRFLNTDAFASTGQGIIGNNMFAYCLNNPVNCADSSGTRCVFISVQLQDKEPSHRTYDSPDDAAMAFYTEVMNQSLYIRHEYATEIYSKEVNGKKVYCYNFPHVGEPHSVWGPQPIPSGTTLVAIAHTHINTDGFSNRDSYMAQLNGVNMYLTGPNLQPLRFNPFTGETEDDFNKIVPVALTNSQMIALRSMYQVSWERHPEEDCSFGCQISQWPTW